MSDTGEYLLGIEHMEGNQGYGYTCKTNLGWAAVPYWSDVDSDSVIYGFRSKVEAQFASTKVLERERKLLARGVSAAFDGQRMYSVDDTYSEERRDFTVTIAGSERHDGEAPYTYVVSDHSQQLAWAQALSWHLRNQDDLDCFVVPNESHDGAPDFPSDTPGKAWNDLRPAVRFWETLDGLKKQIEQFEAQRKPWLDEEGWVKDEHGEDHDYLKADFEPDAFDSARDLVELLPYV